MWPLALLGGGMLFWLWWSGKVHSRDMLPLLLGLLALAFLARGQLPMALGGGAMAALSWFLARRERRRVPAEIARFEAEQLLGLPPEYGQEDIDAAYRERAKRAHPDMGGSAAEMNALTAARRRLTRHLRDADFAHQQKRDR